MARTKAGRRNHFAPVANGNSLTQGWRMNWIYYGLAAALALAAADILVKVTSGKIPDSLGMLLYGTVPFLVGVTWFSVSQHGWPRARPLAILSGLGVGMMYTTVTFCMYAAFRHGAPISIASPGIGLGGLVVASVAGFVVWKEPMTLRYITGCALICAGMYLLLTR